MVKYSSTAFIGIGSNLGDSVSEVNHAITLVEELKDTALTAVSSLYLTEPMGYKYQPDYVNAVIKVETFYSPRELLNELLLIESRRGRLRNGINRPRTLDLDLLLYSNKIINEPGLCVPHPRMHQRAFVLIPLTEIEGSVVISGLGAAKTLLLKISTKGIKKIGNDKI